MWLNLGRLLMLCLWVCMLSNLFHPFPGPANIFINAALIFSVIMHGLQLLLMRVTLAGQHNRSDWLFNLKIFLFGSIELLASQQKMVSISLSRVEVVICLFSMLLTVYKKHHY